jgi:hypothetical protein
MIASQTRDGGRGWWVVGSIKTYLDTLDGKVTRGHPVDVTPWDQFALDADALSRDMPRWLLPHSDWQTVGRLLTIALESVAAEDLSGAQMAISRIEQRSALSPVVDLYSFRAAPETVLEQVSVLAYQVARVAGAGPPVASAESSAESPAKRR